MSRARLVCLLRGHGWVKTPYPGSDTPDGFFLCCRRCGRERGTRHTGVDGGMGGSMGPVHG